MKEFINQTQISIKSKAIKKDKTLEYIGKYEEPISMSRREIIDEFNLIEDCYTKEDIEYSINSIMKGINSPVLKIYNIRDMSSMNKIFTIKEMQDIFNTGSILPMNFYSCILNSLITPIRNKADKEKFMREV